LIHEPELLLLDEPADGLDPLARRQLRDILREVASRRVAIVISSHILRELDGFCDTVALVQKGRIELHGAVDDVIEKYDVGRRLYEVQVTHGLPAAIEILRKHEGLIEDVRPLRKGEANPDPAKDQRGAIRVRIHGAENQAAKLLRELVLSDVEVIGMTKVRSDLEDVYQSMGRDQVS
jgi:ABC-2 type transport system ATP-binding protein